MAHLSKQSNSERVKDINRNFKEDNEQVPKKAHEMIFSIIPNQKMQTKASVTHHCILEGQAKQNTNAGQNVKKTVIHMLLAEMSSGTAALYRRLLFAFLFAVLSIKPKFCTLDNQYTLQH